MLAAESVLEEALQTATLLLQVPCLLCQIVVRTALAGTYLGMMTLLLHLGVPQPTVSRKVTVAAVLQIHRNVCTAYKLGVCL